MTPKSVTPKMNLRGKHLLEMSKLENSHQIGLQARVSANTVAKYINSPETVRFFDLSILVRLLMDGCDLTKEQILALPLGEVFEIVEAEDPEK